MILPLSISRDALSTRSGLGGHLVGSSVVWGKGSPRFMQESKGSLCCGELCRALELQAGVEIMEGAVASQSYILLESLVT